MTTAQAVQGEPDRALQLFHNQHVDESCDGICGRQITDVQHIMFVDDENDEIFCMRCVMKDPDAYPESWVAIAKTEAPKDSVK